MNWLTDEFGVWALKITDGEFGRNYPAYPIPAYHPAWPDDEPQAQVQGINLSMDEVRTSLDEFEQIIRAQLNFCSTQATYTEVVMH